MIYVQCSGKWATLGGRRHNKLPKEWILHLDDFESFFKDRQNEPACQAIKDLRERLPWILSWPVRSEKTVLYSAQARDDLLAALPLSKKGDEPFDNLSCAQIEYFVPDPCIGRLNSQKGDGGATLLPMSAPEFASLAQGLAKIHAACKTLYPAIKRNAAKLSKAIPGAFAYELSIDWDHYRQMGALATPAHARPSFSLAVPPAPFPEAWEIQKGGCRIEEVDSAFDTFAQGSAFCVYNPETNAYLGPQYFDAALTGARLFESLEAAKKKCPGHCIVGEISIAPKSVAFNPAGVHEGLYAKLEALRERDALRAGPGAESDPAACEIERLRSLVKSLGGDPEPPSAPGLTEPKRLRI